MRCRSCFAVSVLPTPKFITVWLKNWRDIAIYAAIPGYRDLPWTARKKLDHQALYLAIYSRNFWRAAFVVMVGLTLAYITIWRFDLSGLQRDLLRCLPFVLAAPGLAAMRRRLIVKLLKK